MKHILLHQGLWWQHFYPSSVDWRFLVPGHPGDPGSCLARVLCCNPNPNIIQGLTSQSTKPCLGWSVVSVKFHRSLSLWVSPSPRVSGSDSALRPLRARAFILSRSPLPLPARLPASQAQCVMSHDPLWDACVVLEILSSSIQSHL